MSESMRHPIRRMPGVTALLAVSLVAGCGDAEPGADDRGGGSPASIPESTWSSDAPTEGRSVATVRSDARDGAEVVVTGRVKDFSAGRAAFTLIDSGLKSCRENEGDTCATPWDYCCVEPDVQRRNTITVELRGADGRPLRAGFKGFHGLDHLQTVTARGGVERDASGNVTLVLSALRRR